MGARSPLTSCFPCNYPCPAAFDLGPYCLTPSAAGQSSTCLVDGLPVSQCVPGFCPSWTLASGSTLTVPVGSLWPTLGPRNDLHWFVDCLPPGAGLAQESVQEASVQEASVQEASVQEASVQEASVPEAATLDASAGFIASPSFDGGPPGTLIVLFDGAPAPGCVCVPNIEISCGNVPQSVQTIGFSYVQSSGASGDASGDAGPESLALAISFDVGECMPSHGGCPQSDVPEGSTY
jgi:hypothetical protein